MNCLIVDDNRLERKVVAELVGKFPFLKIAAELENPIEAMNLIRTGTIHLVFLDIEMPQMNGLEFLRMENSPLVIVMSAKRDYAFEAFEYNVVDYLLKPLVLDRFYRAISRAKELFDANSRQVELHATGDIYVKEKGVITRIHLNDITYLQAMGDYVLIHTLNKRYTLRIPLKSVVDRLPPARFVRVHRSYIVAIDKVETIEEGTISIDRNLIPISEMYRNAFLERLNLL
ncbi:MAG TPA: LytTR family DNA-binding domain-containing protein [Luteibaculaceae bacterium]|nr:LytTR family DNA-binding domain-containing protein [Luteibaculaceae bacterium]